MKNILLTTNLKERQKLAVKPAFTQTLINLAKKDKRIVVLDADLQKCSGTKPFMCKFPKRHFQVAVAEQNLIGIASGMALVGQIPFACTFANFLTKRALDQVSISVAYNQANVKLCGEYAGMTTAKNGGTHCSVEDIAIMRAMPNMRIITPADTIELEQMIRFAVKNKGPIYIRKIRGLMPQLFAKSYRFKFGKAVEMKKGGDLTIIACGVMVYYALLAAKKLEKDNIKARVINMSTIKPLDQAITLKAAKETRKIITLENHSVLGGLGGAVSELLSEKYPCLVKRIGIPDQFGKTADFEWQLKYFKIDPDSIVNIAKKMVKK